MIIKHMIVLFIIKYSIEFYFQILIAYFHCNSMSELKLLFQLWLLDDRLELIRQTSNLCYIDLIYVRVSLASAPYNSKLLNYQFKHTFAV